MKEFEEYSITINNIQKGIINRDVTDLRRIPVYCQKSTLVQEFVGQYAGSTTELCLNNIGYYITLSPKYIIQLCKTNTDTEDAIIQTVTCKQKAKCKRVITELIRKAYSIYNSETTIMLDRLTIPV